MLILLYGRDTFRSQQKLNEIIGRYKKIHQSGLNLSWFKEGLDFEKIKETIEAVSMFDEKKLIILEDVFQKSSQDFREKFLDYAEKNELKARKDVIVVLYEKDEIRDTKHKIPVNMFQEFKPLEGFRLVNWIEKEVIKNGGRIEREAAQRLAVYVGNDLWQMKNEINKLISFSNQQTTINSQQVDYLVQSKIDTNIFKTIDALADRDKKTALRLLYEHLDQGENEIYLFSMLIYQIRNLLKLKDLAEKGTPYYLLAKKSGLHPFVVKKSWAQIRNFNLGQLKKIYQRLLETEKQLKTGRIDSQTALDMLVMEI
jgi:DNA polymerase-3 subunit delta